MGKHTKEKKMSDHIAEDILEKYIFKIEDLDRTVAANVESHLGQCLLCSEKEDSLRRFRHGVERHLSEGPTEKDGTFADTLITGRMRALPQRALERRFPEDRVIDAYAEVVAPIKATLPGRVVRFVRTRPIQSTGVALVLGVIAILGSIQFSRPKDDSPSFAEIRNYVLTVYNKEAEVLWKKGVPGMHDWSTETDIIPESTAPKRLLLLSDLDGDKKNDVLLVGSTPEGTYSSDTIYCFSPDGSLRWKTGVGPMISFGPPASTHHSRPVIIDFMSIKSAAGNQTHLFVLASELTFSPTQLFEIDPKNGAILQSFFNRGGLRTLGSVEIDDKGTKAILIGGVNDSYNRACLGVLNPERIEGISPLRGGDVKFQSRLAPLIAYLLFPRSLLAIASHGPLYGSVLSVAIEPDHSLMVRVGESLINPLTGLSSTVSVYYKIAQNLKVLSAMTDDNYVQFARDAVKAGIFESSFAQKQTKELRDSVLYWNGVEFVHELTMKKGFTKTDPSMVTPALP